ncbi:MAG TPA: hypothetical protein VG900_18220 [Hyphomicrobiaceae bacterium]|jgi:hypothetical protein|nr:hypothetical protein [Hyphomicrobiaceae bacterium]
MVKTLQKRAMWAGALFLALSTHAYAFQETTVGGDDKASAPSAPVVEAPKADPSLGKGLNLTVPEVSIGKGTGTELRIPGIGSVGILPKFDFGLELLYGANEDSKLRPETDKLDPDGVQIRGTLKHRF